MFAGKDIVITGAANGIGKALTLKLLEENAVVWAIDKNEQALTELAAEATKRGKELIPITIDISNSAQFVEESEKVFSKAKSLSLWINNAGISGLGDFSEKTHEDFQRVLDINLSSVVLGTRLALKHMEPLGRGIILNMASVAGHLACPYLTAYCASKFAVVGFTLSLREELKLKETPIRICLASPGFVDTQMLEKEKPEGFPEWLGFLLAKPHDVASEILSAIKKGEEDIHPTLNGKVLLKLGRFFPRMATKSSRLLLSKSVKDLLLFRKLPPKH